MKPPLLSDKGDKRLLVPLAVRYKDGITDIKRDVSSQKDRNAPLLVLQVEICQ